MTLLLKRFKKDIQGIAWLAVGLFLGLALWSFEPTDPSLNTLGTSHEVSNYCGYIGSFLADILYQLFGLTSWLLVLGSIRLSWFHFIDRQVTWSFHRAVLVVCLILTGSSLLGLYWPETKLFSDSIHLSGFLGLMFSEGLTLLLNRVGVGILLWSLALVFVVFYTEHSLRELTTKGRDLIERALAARSLAGWAKQKFAEAMENRKPRMDELQPPVEIAAPELADTPHQAEAPRQLKLAFNIEKRVAAKKARLSNMAKVRRRVENWELPKVGDLDGPAEERVKVDNKVISQNVKLLENKLAQFSVKGRVVAVKPGPAVTMFEFKPNADVKISRITELADDLSLALSAESVRIIAPLPGRDVVGIETSNPTRQTVYLREVLEDPDFWSDEIKIPLVLGLQANGSPKVVDLRKMPHLLVAGTTGSGKSVFVISALTGLLFRHSPKTLKLILVDPKQVDLAAFHNIPHLVMPPIREPKKAVVALKWAIKEMEKRYRSMSKFGARNIEGFNEIVGKLTDKELRVHQEENDELVEKGLANQGYYFTEQPYIVIAVEEFGDLMAVDKNNVEQAVVRLAQMARACGIHLILAMQSPRRDVVTGLIKTNIPGRISFKVASKTDSRIILDESGGERLLARGDMLFLAPGVSKPDRHHGAWIPEKEVNQVTEFWSEQSEPEFDSLAMKMLEGTGGGFDLPGGGGLGEEADEYDERYDEVLDFVSSQKEISASLLQRRFRLGYPRAARIIEIFEREGVVGPAQGSKPRSVLVHRS